MRSVKCITTITELSGVFVVSVHACTVDQRFLWPQLHFVLLPQMLQGSCKTTVHKYMYGCSKQVNIDHTYVYYVIFSQSVIVVILVVYVQAKLSSC